MTRDKLRAYVQNQNVQAFLHMIRLGEGTKGPNGYRTMFGGGLFMDMSRHPNKKIVRLSGGKTIISSAAGAYQFIYRTWAALQTQYGFQDFSAGCQDEAAVALIVGRGAIDDILQGRIEIAIAKCNKEWASLPGSPYGQPTVASKRAIAEYVANGGNVYVRQTTMTTNPLQPAPPEIDIPIPALTENTMSDVAPTETRVAAADPPYTSNTMASDLSEVFAPSFAPRPEEKKMFPFIAAALPALLSAAPDLIRLFGKSPVAERNAKMAEKVVEIAKAVTGTASSEEAVNAITNDPAMAEAFRAQARQNFLELEAMADNRIKSAREFSMTVDSPLFGGSKWFTNIRFIHLISLMMLVGSYMGGWIVLHGDFSGDLKAAVVTLMLVGGFTTVAGFWLGSSSGSERKTDMLDPRP